MCIGNDRSRVYHTRRNLLMRGGELGSDEDYPGFFPRSEFANLGVYKHVDWPDGIFWQLLKTDLADYDPRGHRLSHESR